ncbi:MAG: sensor histidine kinase [Cytophagaceae bacterium]
MKHAWLHIVFIIASVTSAFAGKPVIITDSLDRYSLVEDYFDMLEDKTKNLTLQDITSGVYDSKFYPNPDYVGRNVNITSAYWLRIKVINKSKETKRWIIELFDFRMDHFDIYIPDGKGGYIHKTGGDIYPFDKKEYLHKNFIFDIPSLEGEQVFYVRVITDHPVGFIGAIRSSHDSIQYSNKEYFILALFYGVAFAMILYNLFLFISIGEYAYLYYVLYVVSIAFYALSQDGLGFQYVWYDYPPLNIYAPPIAVYSMIVWVLLYAKSFLETRIYTPLIDKFIILILILRTILFVVGIVVDWHYIYNIAVDLIPLGIIFYAGVVIWLKGYRPARFYVLAFTVLFLGFGLSALNQILFLSHNFMTVYSFNLGVFGEMILLSLALADRIKIFRKEKEKAQMETIHQLTENEALKDKLNRELEEKVFERTRELKEKNEQLDAFVYKASHDIKGPLKSIIGLTTVGKMDLPDEKTQVYFDQILKSTKKLDNLLTELLNLTRVKQMKVGKSKFDFKHAVAEVLKSFEHAPNYARMKFDIYIDQRGDFYTDEKIAYSVVQNMIENAIKYMDPSKEKNFLKIDIRTDMNSALMEFEDNGLGIPEELQSRIFDMFFKVNSGSSGSGLGLHITRIGVEKLGGKIEVRSQVRQGSTFIVTLKNLEHESEKTLNP